MKSKPKNNQQQIEKLAELLASLFIHQIEIKHNSKKNKIKNIKKYGNRKYKK